MSFAVVLEGMSVVAYLIILSGGKRLRESGWKVLSLLILLSVVVQVGSVSIVVSVLPPIWDAFTVVIEEANYGQAYLFDNEDRFFAGWKLGESWIYCTVSWGLSLFCTGVLVLAVNTLPSEAGYELIPDHA